jgi:ABC-type multidrug transport system permease subunit
MKAIQIARKVMKEAWREPQLILLYLLFPASMVLLYYFAFGGAGGSMANYLYLKILNQDEGIYGAQLVDSIRTAEFDGKPVFTVEMVSSREEALTALYERKASVLLTIPAGFSQALEKAVQAGEKPAALQVLGDPASDTYTFTVSFLDSLTGQMAERITHWEKEPTITYSFLKGTGKLSDFQAGVPGVVTFGVFFGVIFTALMVVREDVSGTLLRLRMASVGPWDWMLGILLAEIAASIIQVPLTLGIAALLGFPAGPGGLLLTMLVSIILGLAAGGLGLAAASFTHSDGAAVNLATLLMMGPVFLSGALFPMPPVVLGSIGNHAVSLYDLMPTAHATEAIRKVMFFGEGPAQITYELAGLVIFSLVYLAAGAVLYWKLRIQRSN